MQHIERQQDETAVKFLNRMTGELEEAENAKLLNTLPNFYAVIEYYALLREYGADNMGSLLECLDKGANIWPILAFIEKHKLKWFLERRQAVYMLDVMTEAEYLESFNENPLVA